MFEKQWRILIFGIFRILSWYVWFAILKRYVTNKHELRKSIARHYKTTKNILRENQ